MCSRWSWCWTLNKTVYRGPGVGDDNEVVVGLGVGDPVRAGVGLGVG